MQIYPPTKTSRPAPYPHHWGEHIFANGGKDVLYNLGAVILPSNDVPLEGKVNTRNGDGLCGYYSLQESNNKVQAISRQHKIARWILDNPNKVIGKKTVLQHINLDRAGTSSIDYYNHHMGRQPFPNTGHREFQWITPLELVADCIMTGRGIVVCVHVKGDKHGSLFQPFWSYGDRGTGTGTRYLLFNGSHYDNISGEEPFITVNRRGSRKNLQIRLLSNSRGSNGHDSDDSNIRVDSGGDSDGSGDSSDNEASDNDSLDGDANKDNSDSDENAEGNNNGDSSNILTIRRGGDRGSSTNTDMGCDPSLLIGKTVLDFFDGDHNIGEVKSFKSSGGDGTPTSVNNDVLYVVKFENDTVQEYHHADLLPLLVHGDGKYSCLTLKAWLIARKIYKTISESLGSSNASARNLDFLRSIFGFRSNTVITKKAMHVKLKARNRELHSDRTNRLPSNVQYVAKHVLAALRYFSEHYNSIHGGPPPSIDAPIFTDYPPYNSPEFASRCGAQQDDLTQDPFIPPSPQNSPDDGGERLDDPDGKDIPVEQSAFDLVDFDISSLVDDLEAIDNFNLADTLLNPFKLLSSVPPSLCEEYASAYASVAKRLIQACGLPLNYPLRRIQILRSLKWYSVFPQIIFRHPSRDKIRNSHIISVRLRQFLAGNFQVLLSHWFTDVRKERARVMRRRVKSSEELLGQAVDLILGGDIGRGLRLIDSNGISSQEDPQVRDQMEKKHPTPEKPLEWPELPQEWIQLAREKLELHKHLERVLNDADPKAGVGPRGLHVHYLQVLAKGSFNTADAQDAFDLFASLGKLYLTLGMPAWVRLCLGGGLLTALNKVAPEEGVIPDARPVRAEDADTSSWCKALARITAAPVRDTTGPQQLGIGVSGGVELYGIGFKMRFEDAVHKGIAKGLVKADVQNAHNSFPKDDAQRRIIEAALADPRLIPLAVAGDSILRLSTPIYMRDCTSPKRFELLCKGLKGGGQGNALTGQFYVINQNPALKAVQLKFPDVDIKAIQDDITIFGAPEDLFDEMDDEGNVTKVGTLSDLVQELRKCGLDCVLPKFACVGTTPEACAKRPSWLMEPTSIKTADGTIIQARGIDICNNPIGEDLYVETFLRNKLESICKAIKLSSDSLSASSRHANFLAFYHSYQARFDHWIATNNLVFTRPLALKLDAFLREILSTIAGFDIFEVPHEGTPVPSFTEERIALKSKHSGLGFRLYKHRYLLLNSLNNILPQAIDRVDENGNLIKGLWNSLSNLLGAGSFDDTNKDQCWAGFHSSQSSFASDHQSLIRLVKNRHFESHTTLAVDPPEGGIFTASDSCFGYGIKKLHKAIQDVLRDLDYQIVQSFVDSMPGDDQRRIAFCSTHNNPFANSFPLALAPEQSMHFSLQEFTVAMARKFGAAIPQLLPFVGTTVRAEGKSYKMRVDQFGNGVASAPGVKGGYVTEAHNWIQRDAMKQVSNSGVPVKGDSPFSTGNRIFADCLNLGDATRTTEDTEKNLQKLIPDGLIGRFDLDTPFESPPNRLHGCETLVEVKTLAALTMTPNARAQKFQSDVEKRARDLDSKYPGSTFTQRLKSYGKDGRYLVLVVGPFANLSDDFMVLCDFLGRVRAHRAINSWNMSPKHALAINRHILITRFGHLAALAWARLILRRFRDSVLPDFTHSAADSDAFSNTYFSNPHRGTYHGRYVPGA